MIAKHRIKIFSDLQRLFKLYEDSQVFTSLLHFKLNGEPVDYDKANIKIKLQIQYLEYIVHSFQKEKNYLFGQITTLRIDFFLLLKQNMELFALIAQYRNVCLESKNKRLKLQKKILKLHKKIENNYMILNNKYLLISQNEDEERKQTKRYSLHRII